MICINCQKEYEGQEAPIGYVDLCSECQDRADIKLAECESQRPNYHAEQREQSDRILICPFCNQFIPVNV